MKLRIGMAYDIHRLVEGRDLILGGVKIPCIKGLYGHSDGDVLIHAVCDALLGAARLGDIGEHFPDNDPKYKDISSGEILNQVLALIKKKGFKISNLDSVIVAESPRLEPFKHQICTKLADILKLDKEDINIKATTNEGIGAIGKGEAIAAYCTALIKTYKLKG